MHELICYFVLVYKYDWFKNINNPKDTNYFTKNFTNCWCGEWLLVNEKVILMVSLNENQ